MKNGKIALSVLLALCVALMLLPAAVVADASVDVSVFGGNAADDGESGSIWEYDHTTRTLTINQNGVTLTGTNASLRVVTAAGVNSITLSGLEMIAPPKQNALTCEATGTMTISLAGGSTLTGGKDNDHWSTGGGLYCAGNLAIDAAAAATLDINGGAGLHGASVNGYDGGYGIRVAAGSISIGSYVTVDAQGGAGGNPQLGTGGNGGIGIYVEGGISNAGTLTAGGGDGAGGGEYGGNGGNGISAGDDIVNNGRIEATGGDGGSYYNGGNGGNGISAAGNIVNNGGIEATGGSGGASAGTTGPGAGGVAISATEVVASAPAIVNMTQSAASTLSFTRQNAGAPNWVVAPDTALASGTLADTTIDVHHSGGGEQVTVSLGFTTTVTVSPATLSFTPGVSATQQKTFTITNTGSIAATDITVGSNSASFSVSPASISSLAAGASQTITVTATGGTADGNTENGTVTVSGANLTANPTIAVSLTTSATTLSVFDTSDNALDAYTFGTLTEGYAGPGELPFTIRNTGICATTGDVTVSVSNSDFTVTSQPPAGIFAEGAETAATISPAAGLAPGSYSATVMVSADGATSTSFTVYLAVERAGYSGPDIFPPTNHSGITYTNRTLTDTPTGVTVGGRMTGGARLTVREQILHTAGSDEACDEIRERQAAGEVIVLYDIALSGGNMGELMVSIPVGSQYDGQTLTILHCNNGKLESVSATVAGGSVTGMFNALSPFAVMGEMRVAVPDEVVQDAPKTGDNPFAWVGAVLVLCAAAAVNRKLKMEN